MSGSRRPQPPTVRLDNRQLELLADRLAEQISQALSDRAPLVDARELARRLGVSRATVYAHSDALGAIRVGGRLRFDPARAVELARPSSDGLAENQKVRPAPPKVSAQTNSRSYREVRHPFMQPTAIWDTTTGLWRDSNGCPTKDQCWRSTGTGTSGLVAQGPDGELGANHQAWEAARRAWRLAH